jgi:hypothetical protein
MRCSAGVEGAKARKGGMRIGVRVYIGQDKKGWGGGGTGRKIAGSVRWFSPSRRLFPPVQYSISLS